MYHRKSKSFSSFSAVCSASDEAVRFFVKAEEKLFLFRLRAMISDELILSLSQLDTLLFQTNGVLFVDENIRNVIDLVSCILTALKLWWVLTIGY